MHHQTTWVNEHVFELDDFCFYQEENNLTTVLYRYIPWGVYSWAHIASILIFKNKLYWLNPNQRGSGAWKISLWLTTSSPVCIWRDSPLAPDCNSHGVYDSAFENILWSSVQSLLKAWAWGKLTQTWRLHASLVCLLLLFLVLHSMFSLTLIIDPPFSLGEQLLLLLLVDGPLHMPSVHSMVLSWVSLVVDHNIHADDEPALSVTDGANVKFMKMSRLGGILMLL